MEISQDFFVRMEDTGKDYRLSNKGCLIMLSNLACIHGRKAGQGVMDREKCHMSWMVVGWRLQVHKRPVLTETVHGVSWASGAGRLQTTRDFVLYDERGNTAAMATSSWLVLDEHNTKILRMTPDIIKPYGMEPDRQNFPDFLFPREAPAFIPERTVTVKISRSMIDCNNHVHNTAYLDLFNEPLPDGEEIDRFNDMTIVYKKEIRPGECVDVLWGSAGEKRIALIRESGTETIHAFCLLC